jgi:hypothetical protein
MSTVKTLTARNFQAHERALARKQSAKNRPGIFRKMLPALSYIGKGVKRIFVNKQDEMKGFNVAGVGNESKGDMIGVNVCGLVNGSKGSMKGLNFGVIGNQSEGDMIGVNVGGYSNTSKNMKGLSIAGLFGNGCEDDIRGLSVAGMINLSERLVGIALSLVNVVTSPSKGVQIGLLNVRTDAPWYAKVIPFIAFRFSEKSTKKYLEEFEAIKENPDQELIKANRKFLKEQYAELKQSEVVCTAELEKFARIIVNRKLIRSLGKTLKCKDATAQEKAETRDMVKMIAHDDIYPEELREMAVKMIENARSA